MISLAQTQRRRYYEPKLPRVISLPQWVGLQLKMSYPKRPTTALQHRRYGPPKKAPGASQAQGQASAAT